MLKQEEGNGVGALCCTLLAAQTPSPAEHPWKLSSDFWASIGLFRSRSRIEKGTSPHLYSTVGMVPFQWHPSGHSLLHIQQVAVHLRDGSTVCHVSCRKFTPGTCKVSRMKEDCAAFLGERGVCAH